MHGDKVKSVYCHWDGYLSNNGRLLQEHYDSAKANQLVAMGDMSSLGRVIGEAHPFSPVVSDTEEFKALPEAEQERIKAETTALYEAAREAGYCTFYNRDRGETGTEFQVAHTFEEFFKQADGCGAEYYYIMKDGVWYVGDTYDHSPLSKRLTALTEALEKEAA
jgi:hypothetical protein